MNPGDARLHFPATARNREPILEVLRRVLPRQGLVLEVASGSGEHAAFFAAALPDLVWQPSDCDRSLLASIAAHAAASGSANFRPPLYLDVLDQPWPVERCEAVICINMLHIAPWVAGLALLKGAAAVLSEGAPLCLYGPFRREGRHTAPSNEAFDRSLRMQDPAWGVRDLESVVETAAPLGLVLDETVAMPANNLSIILRRRPRGDAAS